MTAYWLERAWTGEGPVRSGVRVTVEDGVFTEVAEAEPDGAERLAGLTVPGLANCHSHAFHRALRGRTQRERGTFWTWREQMYGVAARLTPDSYFELARATYREMVAGGITSVGEFHYLHHGLDGTPYDDPNAMGHALVEAAREAGIRIALLDTCYLAAGIGRAPEGVQVRFSDGSADAWAERVSARWSGSTGTTSAGAPPCTRSAPSRATRCRSWPPGPRRPPPRCTCTCPSRSRRTTPASQAYGATPAAVLAEAGALGPRTSAVHATHLTDEDVRLLGLSGTRACFCPTTERDLGDGIGPSRRLLDAGSPLTLGSDSHAVVDLFEEMRAVELDERLATQRRGHWSADELLVAATRDGHASLGFDGAGRIEVGARADLVTLDTTSPRTAGTGADAGTAVFAATAADVVRVLRDGVDVTADPREVGAELDRVIGRILS